MSKKTFSSFKDLVVSGDWGAEEQETDLKSIHEIFTYLDLNFLMSGLKEMSDSERKKIKKLFKVVEDPQQWEQEVKSLEPKTLATLQKVFGDRASEAKKQKIQLLKISERYEPKDASVEKKELELRIADIENSIIDIEMRMMTLEREDMQGTESYKKAKEARERRVIAKGKMIKKLKSLGKSSS